MSLKMRRDARLTRPRTAGQLHAYIRSVLGLNMPRRTVIAGHSAPFDYLRHAFFEDECIDQRDCIVWANRGGGKTQIAAIATLLDLVFKPGIQVRILGGSFEQSSKMHRYLKRLLVDSELFDDMIAGNFTGRFVELTNGSRVEVLSQSECAVRGQRVHKLRCDEVELFDREIWEAAQMVTRSGRCGGVCVRAAIETLSTMHEPFGLMQELVRNAEAQRRRIFRWSVMDVLQHCDDRWSCGVAGDRCPLWNECQGRAKQSSVRGFLRIDDAIQQKRRVGRQTWLAEMLCEQPSRANCVYPEFDPKVHVFDETAGLSAAENVARQPKHVPQIISVQKHNYALAPNFRQAIIGGIDFGYRDPTVLLWAVVDEQGVVNIVDELIERECVSDRFMQLALERSASNGFGRPQWIGADPAGHQRSDQTGISTIAAWRQAGWNIRTRPMHIEPSIQMVRRRLLRADGFVGLRIHRRCEQLIRSISEYHYPSEKPDSSQPVKDGPDHAADALRYLIVNLDRESSGLKRRGY